MVARPGSRVLVVEDERDVADLIRAILEDEGYEVYVHHDGNCFDAVRAINPDVILCDYMLPLYDGNGVMQRLRREVAPHTPCILISAVPRAAECWREWGADDFLAKPFDLDRLVAAVEWAAGNDGIMWSKRTPFETQDTQQAS